MRGENIVRIIALIGLCGLVYYFSFDQGRRAQQPRLERLNQRLAAKDRVIANLASEVKRLKDQEAQLQDRLGRSEAPSSDSQTSQDLKRVVIRLHSSRILFDQRLALTCLDIDRERNQATLQINLIEENQIKTSVVQLGRSFSFKLGGATRTLFLDQIQSSFVTILILKP